MTSEIRVLKCRVDLHEICFKKNNQKGEAPGGLLVLVPRPPMIIASFTDGRASVSFD